MLAPRIASVTPAIVIARTDSETASGSMVRAGSGTIVTAPMAVKWCSTIASVSRTAADSVVRAPRRRAATVSAATASRMPKAIEAATRAADQVTRPGTCSAAIPV